VKPLRGIILYHLDVEKNQTLIKAIYQNVPSQKWPTKLEVAWLLGQMSFGPDYGIVCQNEAISDIHVDLGMARNATEAYFHFVPQKVCFPFSECRNQIFCEAATKTVNEKLGTTSHINNRPSGIHISALVSPHKLLELSFGFYTNSYRFRWNRGGFAL
jgi:hypothetical protein